MIRNTPLRCAFLFLCALALFPLTKADDLVRPMAPNPVSETNPSLGTHHLADRNEDGRLDRAVSDNSCNDSTVRPGKGDGNLSRSPQAGNGSFPPIPVPDSCFDATAGAVQAEGIDANGSLEPAGKIEYGSSTGVSQEKGDGSSVKLNSIQMAANSLATRDFDGDGIPDLVLAYYNLYFLKGSGDGTFGLPVQVPSSSGLNYVMEGDLDGDGEPDLVALDQADPGHVLAFLGDGAGGFALAGSFPVGGYPQRAALGDFDGDGHQDLVVTNNGDDVSVLLGHGDGTFDPESRYPAGVSPSGVGIADFNLDGAQDIAAANWNPEAISLYFGNGDGTFQPETRLPSSLTRHTPLAVADFNGDGKEDFAVGGQVARFEVFLSQGDGTFQPPALYYVPGWGAVPDLALGDFNGDGILDVAASGFQDLENLTGTITLYYGVGNGRFLQGVSLDTDGYTSDLVVSADFNGDGVDDLVVAPGVQILLIQPPSTGPCQDADGDGFGDPGSTTCPAGALPDCDDTNAAISPLAEDVCDGIDENCDGLDGTDNDADGFTPCTGDCEEFGPISYSIFPGAREYCDGIDEDCDGSMDVPAEVAKDLTFAAAGDTLSWSPAIAYSIAYNVYRGPLGPGGFAFNQACFVSALASPQATDTDPIPVPGQGYYYIVSGSNDCGEGTLGFLSDLEERPNLLACP